MNKLLSILFLLFLSNFLQAQGFGIGQNAPIANIERNSYVEYYDTLNNVIYTADWKNNVWVKNVYSNELSTRLIKLNSDSTKAITTNRSLKDYAGSRYLWAIFSAYTSRAEMRQVRFVADSLEIVPLRNYTSNTISFDGNTISDSDNKLTQFNIGEVITITGGSNERTVLVTGFEFTLTGVKLTTSSTFTTETEGTSINLSVNFVEEHNENDLILFQFTPDVYCEKLGVSQFATASENAKQINRAARLAGKFRSSVYIPSGDIDVDKTLFFGKKGDGDNNPASVIGSYNTQIVSSINKGAVIDMIGANFIHLDGLRIRSEGTADYGIFQTRYDPVASLNLNTVRSTGNGLFENLTVTGSYSEAALYNRQAETDKYINCLFTNNVATGHAYKRTYVYTASEVSDFSPVIGQVTVGEESTNTFTKFYGCNFFGAGGQVIYLGSPSSVTFDMCLVDVSDQTGVQYFITQEQANKQPSRIRIRDGVFHAQHDYSVVIDEDTEVSELTIINNNLRGSSHIADVASLGNNSIIKRSHLEVNTISMPGTGCRIEESVVDLSKGSGTSVSIDVPYMSGEIRGITADFANVTIADDNTSMFDLEKGEIYGKRVLTTAANFTADRHTNLLDCVANSNPITVDISNVDIISIGARSNATNAVTLSTGTNNIRVSGAGGLVSSYQLLTNEVVQVTQANGFVNISK